MGDLKLSAHFSRSEFACKCGCGFDTVDVKLIQVLEAIRSAVGKPLIIKSGCRCLSHNIRVGGAKKSQHLFGRAADIWLRGHDGEEMARLAEIILLGMNGGGGLALHSNFCHVDVRTANRVIKWKYQE